MSFSYLSENKRLLAAINRLHRDAWPAFLSYDKVVRTHWRSVYTRFSDYQFLFRATGRYAAVGNCAPIYWDGDVDGLPAGFDDALMRILSKGDEPNCLCGLAAVIHKRYQGRGYSRLVIEHMKHLARKAGFCRLILPVRPSLKPLYPTIATEDYLKWKKGEYAFDPWIRTHQRLGGRMVKIASPSMEVTGSVADWQAWTGLHFGSSGDYVVPGALHMVRVNRAADRGSYREDNVWIVHDC